MIDRSDGERRIVITVVANLEDERWIGKALVLTSRGLEIAVAQAGGGRG